VALVEKDLVKARGLFLWTVLVLNELSDSDSENKKTHLVENVPRGMVPLCRRTPELVS
jgi:hypothetical protein